MVKNAWWEFVMDSPFQIKLQWTGVNTVYWFQSLSAYRWNCGHLIEPKLVTGTVTAIYGQSKRAAIYPTGCTNAN